MRVFVGVFPSAEAVAHLLPVAQSLSVVRAGVPLTQPAGWHVTLAFLGDVDDERIPAVHDAVAAGAAEGRPGELSVSGGGRFGATVLWAGLAGDTDALARTARAVKRGLRAARFAPDDSFAFRPHLTLARPRGRSDAAALRADAATLGAYQGPVWPLAEVTLVRSHLGATVHYERLASWPLGSG